MENNSVNPPSSKFKVLKIVSVEAVLILIIGTILFFLFGGKFLGNKKSANTLVGRGFDPNHVVSPIPTPTIVPVKGEISAVSDIPSYSLTLNNGDNLIQIFTGWGVFGRVYSDPGSSTVSLPLQKINIHLTGTQQNLFLVGGPQKSIISSSGLRFNGSSLNLYIYINPSVLSDPAKSPGRLILSQTLTTLYGIAYNVSSIEEMNAANHIVAQTMETLSAKQSPFFQVAKK